MKLHGKQLLNALYQVRVFRAHRKSKMAATGSDWLTHFGILFYNHCTEFHETSQEASTQCPLPIYVFLGDSHALIDFARALHRHPKVNQDEYVVITVDDRQYSSSSKTYFLKTPFETDLKTSHVEAFKPVLVVSPRHPNSTKWSAFLTDVRQLNTEPPINLPKPPNIPNITVVGTPLSYRQEKLCHIRHKQVAQQVPIYAAYLYDAIMVYARAVNQLLLEGKSVYNGSAVVQWIQNRSHMSIQGFEVYIDPQGDAEGNYSLLSLKMTKNKPPSLQAFGGFQRKSNGLGIPNFSLVQEIDWPLGHPPLDQPKCGFDGKKCEHKPDWKLATFCSLVGAVVALAAIFVFRYYRYEKKLARLLWKIEFKDLVLLDSVEEIVTHRKPKRKSNSSWRFLIDGDEPERATLLGNTKQDKKQSVWEQKRIGSYKGNIVSIKCLVKKHVVINRSLKKQLQLRKELTHDNVNRFIGASINEPYIYVVTQYCVRGSLEVSPSTS
ncbi:hypothetical protein FSP39_004136 [Pinctada imbricata]|uniref:Receptor ligand binding region domain-containing protein n=1 Tax=Pinctada imbricata TaxID=66713 RepID=A0AA89BVZ8_PINIB|nr:hypothetical protein FSP39_004136 [Pinctada imbricata]